jgi:hypothetical protein
MTNGLWILEHDAFNYSGAQWGQCYRFANCDVFFKVGSVFLRVCIDFFGRWRLDCRAFVWYLVVSFLEKTITSNNYHSGNIGTIIASAIYCFKS